MTASETIEIRGIDREIIRYEDGTAEVRIHGVVVVRRASMWRVDDSRGEWVALTVDPVSAACYQAEWYSVRPDPGIYVGLDRGL